MTNYKKTMFKKDTREAIYGFVFASPWIIGFLLFTLIPLGVSLYYSFTSYNMITDPKFIYLDNYIELILRDPDFKKGLCNTLYHVAIATPFSIILGILVAILLNKPIKGLGVWRTIFYLPNVVSSVAMALLWKWMFDKNYGLINRVLGTDINWLGDANVVKISLILMGAWGSGVTALFFLGAMKSIPKELYESSNLAGAKKINQFFDITLPLITPTILFMLITTVIGQFQMFTLAYIMTGGGPDKASYYLAYYLYDKAFLQKQMGMASAISWIMFVMVMIVVWVILKTSKKWVFYLGSHS